MVFITFSIQNYFSLSLSTSDATSIWEKELAQIGLSGMVQLVPHSNVFFGTISGRKPWMINMRDYRGDNYLGRNIGNTDVKGCGTTPASDNYFVSSFVA